MVLHMLLPIACCGFQIEYFREKSCLVFKKSVLVTTEAPFHRFILNRIYTVA